MPNTEIRITDLESGESKTIITSGYLIFFIESDKIKMDGKMDIKALAPILTRIALEKLSR